MVYVMKDKNQCDISINYPNLQLDFFLLDSPMTCSFQNFVWSGSYDHDLSHIYSNYLWVRDEDIIILTIPNLPPAVLTYFEQINKSILFFSNILFYFILFYNRGINMGLHPAY